MLNILHIITTLHGGGAEMALQRLLSADRRNEHHVVSLTNGDVPDGLARRANVHTLDMGYGRFAKGVRKLFQLTRDIQPDVVQTWMYHADLLGGVVARLASNAPVCWGIRNAYLDKDATSLRTRLVVQICAWLSHVVPARIISCSHVAARLHAGRGYDSEKLCVIHNGYDAALIVRDPSAGATLRNEWNVREGEFVFGMVARWDPQKDHGNLVSALAHLRTQMRRPWRCVLVGPGIDDGNRALSRLIENAGVKQYVIAAGAHPNVSAVMSALDVHVLASRGEAFPNVVAEAMCCETPCIVTDVGEAPYIAGDTGWVVPPRDPQALADALCAAGNDVAEPNRLTERGAAARARIVAEFGLERMARGYDEIWNAVLNERERDLALAKST